MSDPKGRGGDWTPPASQSGAAPPGPRSEGRATREAEEIVPWLRNYLDSLP